MQTCNSISQRLMYHAVLSYYIPSCNSISTRLRYHVVLPPTSHQAIPSASSWCIIQSYQSTSKHTIPSAKWVATKQYYHPTSTLAVQSLHGLGIMQSYQPTSYHAIPSLHGLGIMQSYQPTSKHANSISQAGIATIQYVLSPYIQSCNSITPLPAKQSDQPTKYAATQ